LKGLQVIHDPDFAYRRAGVALIGLVSKEAWQLSLLQDSSQLDKRTALMQSVDQLNVKYNTRLVRHGSEHLELTGWHSNHKLRSPAYTTSWNDLPVIG
jgi:DNA polymerase V